MDVILRSGILQYSCSLLTKGSSPTSPQIPQRRHKHFLPKKSIFVWYCSWILYKFALSPKYHPFWIATQHREYSPLLSGWGRPPTLIHQQEKLFLSQLRCCASVCENISALPFFLWRANEMKLLSSVNCFRLWLAVVGSEIAFLSPSPLLSLSRSLPHPPVLSHHPTVALWVIALWWKSSVRRRRWGTKHGEIRNGGRLLFLLIFIMHGEHVITSP